MLCYSNSSTESFARLVAAKCSQCLAIEKEELIPWDAMNLYIMEQWKKLYHPFAVYFNEMNVLLYNFRSPEHAREMQHGGHWIFYLFYVEFDESCLPDYRHDDYDKMISRHWYEPLDTNKQG